MRRPLWLEQSEPGRERGGKGGGGRATLWVTRGLGLQCWGRDESREGFEHRRYMIYVFQNVHNHLKNNYTLHK